jgi:hypothetical protein
MSREEGEPSISLIINLTGKRPIIKTIPQSWLAGFVEGLATGGNLENLEGASPGGPIEPENTQPSLEA